MPPTLLLNDVFPNLSKGLVVLLNTKGETNLAAQVADLSIVDRCRCGDEFCGLFYTLPKRKEAYGSGLRCVDLNPEEGMIILDVVDEKIASVEVLCRDEVRRKLLGLFP